MRMKNIASKFKSTNQDSGPLTFVKVSFLLMRKGDWNKVEIEPKFDRKSNHFQKDLEDLNLNITSLAQPS